MISVIIPTFERPDKISDAIASVKEQSYKDIEIIVVDDNGIGSKMQMETQKAVESFNGDNIKYIAHDKNKGGCAARNTGIKNASGDLVAFLDDDDVWSKFFLEKQSKYFEDDSVGAVYCLFYSYNGEYSITAKKPRCEEGDVYSKILSGWCPASTSLFIVKKKAIIDVGCFDEELTSFQDYDMWLRLSKKYQFRCCPEYLVLKYEGVGEQTSKNPKRRVNGYKHVVEKHEKSLSGDELQLFQSFKEKYYYDTLLRCILYNKQHGFPYKKDVAKYVRHCKPFSEKLKTYLRLAMNDKIKKFLFKRKKSKQNNDIIIYQGPYPV